MKKIKNWALPVGVILIQSSAVASMMDQMLYNVAGQVSNAAGARLSDEIYQRNTPRYNEPQQRHTTQYRQVHKNTYDQHKRTYTKKKRKKYVVTDEMKIQKALKGLGFYHGTIDGEVNSFETRSAIKKMNRNYGISHSASLKPEVKDSLIYLGTLFMFDRYLIARGNDKRTKGKRIQTALKIHGFYHGKIDGAVGRGTRRSIRKYKAAQGLSSGSRLDFEEEYQLISTAKKMNDHEIEETIASLKSESGTNTNNKTTVTQTQRPSSVKQESVHSETPQSTREIQVVQTVEPVQTVQTVQVPQPIDVSPQSSTSGDDELQMYTDE